MLTNDNRPDPVDRDLDSFWLPFTSNRTFRARPRVIESAEGFYYQTTDGRSILDSFSGLWTTGLGHCHPRIVSAVQQQVATLDYAAAFQITNSTALAAASRLTRFAPEGFDKVFFANSGSEAVDTALKMAIGYHRLRGEAGRTRFVGREKGYHGCNIGGTSVGGIPPNRRLFEPVLLSRVDHLPHTLDLERNAFTRGQPAHGAELAEALEGIVALHGPENIAAVIVEPVSGSAGVIIPPEGYLQRLREICTRHGILLIFDEVITAFYRVGASFASERLKVRPDIIVTAKGLTNGVVPMAAVLVSDEIYRTFMTGPEYGVEFFHGHTYSGHPVAAAAALATLDIYADEDVEAQVRQLEPQFEEAIHALADAPHVLDIRNFGLMGAIELKPRAGEPGARGMECHLYCFERGLMVRHGMDTLQFSPFLTSTPELFEQTFSTVRQALETLA